MGGCGLLSSRRRAGRQHLGSMAPLAIFAPARAVAGHIAAQREAGMQSAKLGSKAPPLRKSDPAPADSYTRPQQDRNHGHYFAPKWAQSTLIGHDYFALDCKSEDDRQKQTRHLEPKGIVVVTLDRFGKEEQAACDDH